MSNNTIEVKARLSSALSAKASLQKPLAASSTTTKLDCDSLEQLVTKSTLTEVLSATDAAGKTIPLITAASSSQSVSGINAISDKDKFLDVQSGIAAPDYLDAKNIENTLSNNTSINATFTDDHNSYKVERIETNGTYNAMDIEVSYGAQGEAVSVMSLPFEYEARGTISITYKKMTGSQDSNVRLFLRKKPSSLVVSAGDYDVDALPLFNVMTDLSSTDKENISTLIADLKACDCWKGLDVLYVFAANNAPNALINWKDPNRFNSSVYNAPTFSSYKGYSFNGIDQYMDTNFNPSVEVSNGSKYQGADASMGVYIRSANVTASFHCVAGAGDHNSNATNRTALNTYHFYYGPSAWLNDSTGNSAVSSSLSYVPGIFYGYRRDISNINRVVLLNNNVTKSSTPTTNSPGPSNFSIYIGCFRKGLTNKETFFNGQLALFFLGNSDMHNNTSGFYNAIQNYMTAVGANV